MNAWLACALFVPGAWQGKNDFLGFYKGAKLVHTSGLYDREATRELQTQTIGETAEIQFGRLPCFALLLSPLGLAPYRVAYSIWLGLQAAAFLGFVALWPGGAIAQRCIISCWFLPAFVCLFNGQDDLLLLLWAGLSLRQLRSQKPVLAGVLLALCASKFHLFALVPLVIVGQRRWRLAGGLVLGACGLAGLSFVAAGSTWPIQYWSVLTDQRMSTGLRHMPNLHSLAEFAHLGSEVQIAASLLIAAALLLVARRSSSFDEPFAIALVAGVLLGFHSYLADTVLFLPALMTFSTGGAVRLAGLVLITPIPWFYLQLPEPLPALTQLFILLFVVLCLTRLNRGRGTLPLLQMRCPELLSCPQA